MRFFRIHAQPSRRLALLMSVVLFGACVAAYVAIAYVRHRDNPQDKVVPTLGQLADGFYRAAFETDREGQYRLLVDTWASTKRFAISVALLFVAVLLGLHMGLLPYVEHLFLRFLLFFDKVPALALLPILFIAFGLDETSKIALIVIGVFPTIALDTYLRTKSVPQEQIIKGFTLGATDFEIAYRIVLPQILPQVLDTVRLNLKSVVLFLIAGESLAATAGLGYRIFVVRRYLAMDIIIPYVMWLSLLAFAGDRALRLWIGWRYRWTAVETSDA
jgi:NitT/TauT family transport system permease protein